MRRFAKVERIQHTNLTARLPKKCFLPPRIMPANITLTEMCVCIIIMINHKMRLILFLIQTLWKPGHSMLASALETMSLHEIGPQLKFPR